jgi:hypothetical protein
MTTLNTQDAGREERLLQLRIQAAEVELRLLQERNRNKGKERVRDTELDREKEREKRSDKRKRSKEKTKKKKKTIEKDKQPALKKGRYGVTVTNPLTGQKLTVWDLSNKNNRILYNYIQRARAETKDLGKIGPVGDAVAEMISKALQVGLKFNDPSRLPEDLLDAAKKKLKERVGEERYEAEFATEAEDDSTEVFHNDFLKQSLTSDNWPGEGNLCSFCSGLCGSVLNQ